DEQFRAVARYEDQGMRLLATQAQILLENRPDQETGDRPEVDRTELRAILLDSVDTGGVRWGWDLRSVRQAHDKTYQLLFEHGLSETFDLVVVADGVWARVRHLLSSATRAYVGVTDIHF